MSELKHDLHISVRIPADSVECARTVAYQSLTGLGADKICFSDAVVQVITKTVVREKWLTPKREEYEHFWKSQDWQNKTIEDISIETGKSTQVVGRWRRLLLGSFPVKVKRAKERLVLAAGKVPEMKWETLDWQKLDAELGRELGVSRERVRQMRKRLGKPRPEKSAINYKRLQLGNEIKARWDEFSKLTLGEIAISMKRPSGTVSKAMKVVGLRWRPKKRKWDWGLVNFALPNKTIIEIWGLPKCQVGNWRMKHNIPAAQWDSRKVPEYAKALIEAEKVKAATTSPNKGKP